MFGPVSSRMLCLVAIQIKIVGHKAIVAAGQFLLFDHRVTAFDNFQVAARFVEVRPAIVAQRRDVRQRSEHVDLCQRQRGLADALGLGGNGRAQLGEQAPLDLDDLFLCVQNLRLRIPLAREW